MTIVIGIHGGDFVLIGADTRSMQLNNDGVNWDIDDTVQKVFPTGIGVMSGAGHLAAIQLTEIRMRLAVKSTELAESIVDAIADIRQHVPEQADGARQVTHLMQSYVGIDGGLARDHWTRG